MKFMEQLQLKRVAFLMQVPSFLHGEIAQGSVARKWVETQIWLKEIKLLILSINMRIIHCLTLPCMHVPLWQYISDPHSSSEMHGTKTDYCMYVNKETLCLIFKKRHYISITILYTLDRYLS